jgi:hypothetical protein
MMRLAITAALVASACTQSAMSVESYADAMEAIADAYVSEAQGLSASYQRTVEDEVRAAIAEDPTGAQVRAVEIAGEATVSYLELLADAMDRFITSMDELRPPTGVEAAHDEFVGAVASVHGSLPDARDAVAGADSLSDIRLALTTSGFADGQLRWTAACTALEGSVRRQGAGLDLGCVRQEVAP